MVIGIYITAFPFNFHQTSPQSLPELRLMCLRRFVKITIRTLRPAVAAGVADDRMDVDTAFPLRFTMLKKKTVTSSYHKNTQKTRKFSRIPRNTRKSFGYNLMCVHMLVWIKKRRDQPQQHGIPPEQWGEEKASGPHIKLSMGVGCRRFFPNGCCMRIVDFLYL